MTKSRIIGAAALLLSSALIIPSAMAQSDNNSTKPTSTKSMQHQSSAPSALKRNKMASSHVRHDRRHQARYGRSSDRYASNSWDNTVDADYNLGGPSVRRVDGDVAYNDNWNNRPNSNWNNTVEADYNLGGPSGNRINSQAAYNGNGYNGWNRQDNGFWPANTAANIVGGAFDTAGAVAVGAVDTAGAIATAPFRNDGYASYDNNYNNGWNNNGWNNNGRNSGYRDSNAAFYGNPYNYNQAGYDNTYASRNGFVCQPGTWFKGEDGRRHICQ